MSVLLISDVTSRMRGILKGVRQDSWLTDRFLYSVFRKHASLAIKRLDEKKRLMGFNSIFETLDYVALEECDRVEAGCSGVKSYKTFRKTKLPVPVFTEGIWGPMVRSITSLDGSTPFQLTNLDNYIILTKQKSYRFNKTLYCWYLNDRLYFPDIDWPAVRIEGMFEEDISEFKCCDEDRCKPRQQQSLNIPDYIISEIEKNALSELGFSLQIPSDSNHDAQNPNR